MFFFFSSRRRHTRSDRDWSSDVCSSDLSIVLPATALGAFSMARIARMARSGMLEVLAQDYVRTARAAGIRTFVVTYKYALKNAAIPLVTIIGLEFGILLGGAVITETIFAWPGVG